MTKEFPNAPVHCAELRRHLGSSLSGRFLGGCGNVVGGVSRESSKRNDGTVDQMNDEPVPEPAQLHLDAVYRPYVDLDSAQSVVSCAVETQSGLQQDNRREPSVEETIDRRTAGCDRIVAHVYRSEIRNVARMPDRAAAGRNRSANQRYGSFTVFHTHRHTHVTCIVVRRRPASATVRMPRPCAWPADSPLRAVESLDAARTVGDGDSPLVFPSVGGKPLSYEPLYTVLKAHGIAAVPHGFRSSFRDWAAEKTDHPREVVEAALAHVVRNPVEAAYARSEFERRRLLMDDWAEHLAGEGR